MWERGQGKHVEGQRGCTSASAKGLGECHDATSKFVFDVTVLI